MSGWQVWIFVAQNWNEIKTLKFHVIEKKIWSKYILMLFMGYHIKLSDSKELLKQIWELFF